MGYHGTRRAGRRRPATIEGQVLAIGAAPAELPRVGRWAFAWAWLRARREIRRVDRTAAMVAAGDAGTRAPGYVRRHDAGRRVIAVTVRLDRARRSDVRSPVVVSVGRGGGSREKTPARHSCAGTAVRRRTAAQRHRMDTDHTMSVADVLAEIERSADRVRA